MQYKDTFLKSNKSHIYSHQIANCTGRNSVNIKQNPDLNSRLAEHKPDTLTNEYDDIQSIRYYANIKQTKSECIRHCDVSVFFFFSFLLLINLKGFFSPNVSSYESMDCMIVTQHFMIHHQKIMYMPF